MKHGREREPTRQDGMGRVADDDNLASDQLGNGFTIQKGPALDLGCFAEVLVELVS